MKYEYEHYIVIRIKEENGDPIKVMQAIKKECPEVLAKAEIIGETKRIEKGEKE